MTPTPPSQVTDQPDADTPLSELQLAYRFGSRAGLELGVVPRCRVELRRPSTPPAVVQAAVDVVTARYPPALCSRIEGERQRVDRQAQVLVRPGPPAAGEPAGPDATRPLTLTRRNEGGETVLELVFDLHFVDLPSLRHVVDDLVVILENGEPVAIDPPDEDYPTALTALTQALPADRDARYWRDRLDSLPPAPELALAIAPEQVTRPLFETLSHRLAPKRWQALRRTAERQGLGPREVLLGAYTEVLRTWSKSAELTVNVAGTGHDLVPGFEQEVGQLGLPVLLGVTGARDQTVQERFAGLAERLARDEEHRTVSGLHVLRELGRSGSGRTSMPVVFTPVLGGRHPIERGRTRLTGLATQTPQVSLENQVVGVGDGLLIAWNHVPELHLHLKRDTDLGVAGRASRIPAQGPGDFEALRRREPVPVQPTRVPDADTRVGDQPRAESQCSS